LRTERSYGKDGIRYRIVEQSRTRYQPKPISRTRSPIGGADPDQILARLDNERAAMAERVLREGARGWKQWSTVRRRAGAEFSPFLVETELLDDLVRDAGCEINDRWHAAHEEWRPQRFRVDETIWPWLGILDPEAIRAELATELTRPQLLEALEAGPPAGMNWGGFRFVLLAGERVLDLDEHGITPGERELAGLVDHTKAWTPRRRQLLAELLGRPFEELVAKRDRQLGIRGPVAHSEGGIWASAIHSVQLAVNEDARGAILVENAETFRHLLPLADQGWIVIHIPGGPPPAEAELVRRLAALAPSLDFHAAFDLDPAGIQIALLLHQRTGVRLTSEGMRPELLAEAEHPLDLTSWDRDRLRHLRGTSGIFEPLREAIEIHDYKVEQETYQRALFGLFSERRRALTLDACRTSHQF
jgi:uncharacterized protein DUF2399